MTRTHEQVRLPKPADRTTEMRAVDREDLKLVSLFASYPTGNIGCLTVPRTCVRVRVFREARLVLRKIGNWPNRNPRLIRSSLAKAGEQITKYGYTNKDAGNTVQ